MTSEWVGQQLEPTQTEVVKLRKHSSAHIWHDKIILIKPESHLVPNKRISVLWNGILVIEIALQFGLGLCSRGTAVAANYIAQHIYPWDHVSAPTGVGFLVWLNYPEVTALCSSHKNSPCRHHIANRFRISQPNPRMQGWCRNVMSKANGLSGQEYISRTFCNLTWMVPLSNSVILAKNILTVSESCLDWWTCCPLPTVSKDKRGASTISSMRGSVGSVSLDISSLISANFWKLYQCAIIEHRRMQLSVKPREALP